MRFGLGLGLSHAGVPAGGGWTGPEWVPEDSRIHIDFVNNRAWTDADGEVAISTLMGSDPATVAAWGATSYAAGSLTANGYVDPDPVAFIGAAKTLMLAGSTVVVVDKVTVDGAMPQPALYLLSGEGSYGLGLSWNYSGNIVQFGSFNQSYVDEVAALNAHPGENRIAITITPTSGALAVNGTAHGDATWVAESDISASDPIASALFDGLSNHAVKSFTLYDPITSLIELAALSGS